MLKRLPMSALLVTLPSHPLHPPNVEKENSRKPHRKSEIKPLILSSVSLFLKSYFAFFNLKSFSDILEVVRISPEVILMDLSFYEYYEEDYFNNYKRFVFEIKERLPKTKIITLSNKYIEEIDCLFIYDNSWNEKTTITKFKKFIKQNKIDISLDINNCKYLNEDVEICVILDIKNYNLQKEYYRNKEIDYFYFVNYNDSFDLNCLENITYKLAVNFNQMLSLDLNTLTKSCCHQLVCSLLLDENTFLEFKENLSKIKQINNSIILQIKIVPIIDNNQIILEFLNYLDSINVNYQISRNLNEINKKQNILLSLLEKNKDNADLKKRMLSQIYYLSNNLNIEDIILILFELDNEYLDVYLDLIHLIDGHFTTEEIIAHLVRLHTIHTKEEIFKHAMNCLSILEKKNIITTSFENTNPEHKSNNIHLKSVYPQRCDLTLFYTGLEKGYFMINHNKLNLKELENISKDIFYFLMFSKGIYYLREVAYKLHLLLGDCTEFSKTNYLKTTQKIYHAFKRYKLCK